MIEPGYFDLHTHKVLKGKYGISNLYPSSFKQDLSDGYYSIGLHPWKIVEADYKTELILVGDYAANKNILAIGETGLDKINFSRF